ncbi:hypothetical protein G7Z17_g11441 [Cylindrodendrum hubeiense]|uniref:Heterokaryon incompatibility domain-containing protein n=1 Tax=Cylindrodendrum hubeiense TaxID=595255 RepID=A0A9P5H3Y4_9HYPO|nr:hypothetical protein G7Z17_g11441 [Cylindrodendrum hubeiense]
MWLLDIDSLELHRYRQAVDDPPYVALSHCWGDGGITLNDLRSLRAARDVKIESHRAGRRLTQSIPSLPSPVAKRTTSHFLDTGTLGTHTRSRLPQLNEVNHSAAERGTRVLEACAEARTFGVQKLWVDDLCIDRSSSAEISEAINSMFRIFQNARVCLAHLSDLNTQQGPFDTPERRIEQSRWGSRVWVLQEIIAAKDMQFYDNQWTRLGTKKSLLPFLSSFLRIDRAVLENSECLPDFSTGRRMSWAARLSANRSEDVAYSLLGIFGLNLPISGFIPS